ncbi:MAG: class B sortase [Clostridia bacterium]|nr:class B sortase [Clostridia bacterium]
MEKTARDQFDRLSAIVRAAEARPASAAESTADAAVLPAGEPQILPQYLPLYEENPDLFGWVRIDGTPIDYPVMYTPQNPEYYLRRGFDKKYLACGVPFIEAACPANGNYYIICGHHMNNKTMFGTLPYYKDPAYFEAHPTVSFDTLCETREYEIFAAFYSRVYDESDEAAFRYYAYHDLSDPQVFAEYVRGVTGASLYDTGISAEYGDELLALSTCSTHTRDGRFVIVAKRID